MSKDNTPKPTPDFRKMYQLAERYAEASVLLDQQARRGDWGCYGPKMLVDSFAVELYLKCLYVLDRNAPPPEKREGHNWKFIFDALESSTQILIRREFKRIISEDPVLPHLELINPEATKVLDFDRSLAAANHTFDQKRYLYEESKKEGEWFYAHLLRDAFRSITKMDCRLWRIE